MNFSINLRYLGYLKSYARNKRQPEGSIAECYITEECLSYCLRYIDSNAKSKNNHDIEKESPQLFIFSVPGEYNASNLNTGHSHVPKCTTCITIACLTVIKLPLILSTLHYTNFKLS